jgi:hypothetical protein
MADVQTQGLHKLIGDALRETSTLARKEFALFRTEMTDNVRRLVMGIVAFVAAAVFAVAALMLLTEALVEWLARILDSEALAALIVAAVMGAIAIGLALYGRSAVSSASLTPTRTVRSVERDAEVITERVSG